MTSNWVPLLYDKSYDNIHGFNEEKTKKITVDSIDESYKVIKGNDAIDSFNNDCMQASFLIPNIDNSLGFVERYIKNKIKLTVVFINKNKLKDIIKEIKIDGTTSKKYNIEFIKRLCKFHIHYDRNSKEAGLSLNQNVKINDETYKKNISETVNKLMNGVKYNPDDAIDDPVDDEEKFELLTTKLYDYQKCSIGWMVDKERNLDVIKYNTHEEALIGDIYFDLILNDFFETKDRPEIKFYGGGLIDEVGLGKTIQSATLSLLNQPKYISHTIEGLNRFNSRATFVLCPNTLCGQWKRELTNKISKKYNLNIVTLLTKRDYDKYTYEDLCDADFVIASFNYLFNNKIVSDWVSCISVRKNYLESQEFQENKTNEILNKLANNLITNPIYNITKTNPNVMLIKWHRLIIDEFHEIHSNDKYKAVQNLLPLFQANYRWVVTGTPFISTNSMLYMVDFLTNYGSKGNKEILSSLPIIEYLSKKCFRRNTKKSVEQEYKLPPIEEEILLLKFTKTERMMYNAYLADGNNNKFSQYLRQLCCHPNLANETKEALINCKTLKDVEKTMVDHYKKQAINSKLKLIKINTRLDKNIKNINRFLTKQQARVVIDILKKNDYDADKIEEDDDKENIYIETMNDLMIDDHDNKEILDNSHPDQIIKDKIDLDDGLEKEKPNNFKKEKDFTGVLDEIQESYEIKKGGKKLKPEKYTEFIHKYIDIAKNKWKYLDLITLTNMKVNNKEILKIRDDLIQELDGKLTSWRFFSNVVTRIKKTVTVQDNKPKKPFSLEDSDSESDNDDEEDDEETCGVCMCEVEGEDVGVSKCGHIFCYNCIKTWVEKRNNCPSCRKNLSLSGVYLVSYEKPKLEITDEKQLSKQELINEVGTKLANLIEYLKTNDKHTIIFSQWDDLLNKVGDILKKHGIHNVFCKGNVFQRDKAVREFNSDDKIKVIMLSSESAASGTNLTKASQIILLDPVYGSYTHRRDTENQAIGRSHRLGQKNKLKVVRFIIKDSVEEDIYKMNKEEDKKHTSQRKIKEISIDE